jgi:hypothetical protein
VFALGKVGIGYLFIIYVVGYFAYTMLVAVLKIAVAEFYKRRQASPPAFADAIVLGIASCATVVGMYAADRVPGTNSGFVVPAIFAVTLVYMDYRQLNHQHIEPRELKADALGVACGLALAVGWHFVGKAEG